MLRKKVWILCTAMAAVFFCALKTHQTLAQSVPDTSATTTDASSGSLKSEVDDLNAQVKAKQDNVKQLDGMIANYEAQIAQQEASSTSLQNEVTLLNDQISKKQLDIQRTNLELDSLKLEIQSLDAQISLSNKQVATEKDQASELVRQIRQSDDTSPLEVLITKRSLSAFFDRVDELKRLEGNLTDAIDRLKTTTASLQDTEKSRTARRQDLADQTIQLKKDQLSLEAERNFKQSLADETKNQETTFQQALFQVKEEQQAAQDEIANIQGSLKDKLDTSDSALARGVVLLDWPVNPSRGITAKFHDPTYPFNNLFPHPGVDVRAYVGTPVHAAAGGYVAWNKKGRLYGNYVMLVHPGNIATVYAHFSQFLATPNTYVNRGDVIGLSGGMPGAPGAGLSTGPHLHFEVRQDGIPVDPENFLPPSGADEE